MASVISKEILDFFSKYIEEQMGIKYKETSYYQLENRLKDIAIQLDFSSVEALYESSRQGVKTFVKTLLLDVATNNETSFFRDKEIFNAFKIGVLDSQKFSKQNPPVLNIWSAACSTGQEVYSLAMMCEEWKKAAPGRFYKIHATDFSSRVLNQASSGEYSSLEIQRGLPALKMVEWFTQETSTIKIFEGHQIWKVKNDLKKSITFSSQNLLSSFMNPGPFDIIFCRNVMIYFEVQTKKQVVEKLHKVLAPEGYLVLGSAESLIGVSDLFKTSKIGKANFYQK